MRALRSRLGSASRDDLKSKLARRAKRKVAKGDQRPTLTGRLGGLGLASHEMKGDGNCQFRSFSFNLFGAQSHYAVVRSAAVAHLRTHADFFSVFFDGEREWKRYLEGMAKNKTWGDELTLRAVRRRVATGSRRRPFATGPRCRPFGDDNAAVLPFEGPRRRRVATGPRCRPFATGPPPRSSRRTAVWHT